MYKLSKNVWDIMQTFGDMDGQTWSDRSLSPHDHDLDGFQPLAVSLRTTIPANSHRCAIEGSTVYKF